MTVPVRYAGASILLALVLAVSGCSSSGTKNDTSPSAGGTSGEHCPAPNGKGVAANVPTKKAITKVYKLFFNTDTSLADSVAILQHGPTFCEPLNVESSSPSANKITAKVSKVVLRGKNVAFVTFTIYTGKQTLLPNTHGFAVREGGKWKVAAKTFCSLISLERKLPPQCKKRSLTALPH
jgi:hypothetical protein